jgi:hypothetical protein
MEFASLSDVSVQYQRGLTLMFGKATSVQTCIYDKTDEVIKSDKEDYWRERWAKHPEFQEGVQVKRVEFRFHHQVVKELGQSQEEEWQAFPAILPHLDHFWRYASRNNRLMWQPGSQFLDPVWQLLHYDVHIEQAKKVKEITLARKKKQSPGAVGKNIAQVIGNLISIMARDSATTVDTIMIELKLMSIWDEVLLWYRLRGMEEGHIRQQCEKALALRRLVGKAA